MMKAPKETWIVVATISFLIAYLIDRLSGPVSIVIGNPIAFLRSSVLLDKYPFTATAIFIRTFALFTSSMIIAELIPGRYFTKAVVLFFVGMLGEFYAIQQLATGFHLTTIQWTLAIAYGSLSLSLAVVWMILKGIWSFFNGGKAQKALTEVPNKEKSVLEPPGEQQQ